MSNNTEIKRLKDRLELLEYADRYRLNPDDQSPYMFKIMSTTNEWTFRFQVRRLFALVVAISTLALLLTSVGFYVGYPETLVHVGWMVYPILFWLLSIVTLKTVQKVLPI